MKDTAEDRQVAARLGHSLDAVGTTGGKATVETARSAKLSELRAYPGMNGIPVTLNERSDPPPAPLTDFAAAVGRYTEKFSAGLECAPSAGALIEWAAANRPVSLSADSARAVAARLQELDAINGAWAEYEAVLHGDLSADREQARFELAANLRLILSRTSDADGDATMGGSPPPQQVGSLAAGPYGHMDASVGDLAKLEEARAAMREFEGPDPAAAKPDYALPKLLFNLRRILAPLVAVALFLLAGCASFRPHRDVCAPGERERITAMNAAKAKVGAP